MTKPEENINSLAAIGERIRTQDNRCTTDPIFQVRGLRRIYGMDPQWTDNLLWIDIEDGAHEVDPPSDSENPGDFIIQTGYVDVWEVLMVAFTEEGCKEHLRLNGHNYRRYEKVEIYADSLNRCPEMQSIRSWLISPTSEEICSAGQFKDKEECIVAVQELREKLYGEFTRH
jgi:hypothetical protein